MLLLHGKDQQ